MGKENNEELVQDIKHGDVVASSGDDNNAGGDDTKVVTPPPPAEPEWKAEMRALEQKLARQESELTALRAPKQPKPKVEEPDWEELLFTDTKQAVALLRKTIRDEVIGEVTSSYKKDQGERDFWGDFYKANEDLKDDDDLVKATLQKNLGELADMPVAKASARLAELTRERIMRYTGQTPKGGKKAVTEGAGQPTAGKKAPEPEKSLTLSDIIKARRAKRLNKATAA